MLTILKKTPITYNGVDCLEVLVKDDCMGDSTPCELCMYQNYDPTENRNATCCDVHGCGLHANTYFLSFDLNTNSPI